MSRYHRGALKTECPYYIKDKNNYITCESPIDGVQIIHKFQSKEAKHEHQKRYCFSVKLCASCPNSKSVTDKNREGKR